ncbi:Proline-rich transmembrane protein 1 [Oryzias melastigma]|uniref:Proline-rich transmembrane protein 1 n=1 Tax=Oryzias melastigma TaxID=30732 RepID=A0A834BRW0_ORYME|nr:Proline-rich transmembrane protein 1 [Oryzias melastigma]
MDSNVTKAFPQESDEERLLMVHNPLPPLHQGMLHQESPPVQAFGNPPQYAGRGYDPPGFVTSANTSRAQRNPVKDYLGFSVFTMLCCCLPFGIFALIQSIIAREANFYQDWMRAERKSRNAKILNCVALGMGILILIPASGFLVYNLIIDDNDD